MLDLFLCYSPQDREVAGAIAERLERTEAQVWRDECGNVASAWEGGTSSGAILLLLSPEAVPARGGRAEWEGVLDHLTRNAEPPLGSVLVHACRYPPLLERKNFFRWPDDVRAIERWIVNLQPPERPGFAPARRPWFEGRQAELDLLWETLVDRAGLGVVKGPAGSGKTSLAQEFARQAGENFRSVLWVGCGERPTASIASDLAAQFGQALGAPLEEAARRLGSLIAQHRLLVVFDNLAQSLPIPFEPDGRASFLITARSAETALVELDRVLTPALEAPADPRLWRAMAVCRPEGFPLDLPAAIAGVDSAECPRLVEQRLADFLDGSRLRLSAAACGADLEPERRRHAEVLHEKFSPRAENPERYFAEFESAFRWAARADWALAVGLAQRAVTWARRQQRVAECIEILRMLFAAAEQWEDDETVKYCRWELSWLEGDRGLVVPGAPPEQLAFEFRLWFDRGPK